MRAASRELGRLGAAELQRHGMLARIEAQQPLAIAVQHRVRRHHLGVEQRPRVSTRWNARQCRSVQSIMGATENV